MRLSGPALLLALCLGVAVGSRAWCSGSAGAARRPIGEAAPTTVRRVTRRRLGVMGGTFDPVHHGHLVAANEVAALFDLDEVVFVPTGRPWQKTSRGSARPRTAT